MNPVDFIDVARQFKQSTNEAERRTAVGRCYYAVLNEARDRIEAAGAVVENAFTHRCVLYYLEQAGLRGIREARETHVTLSSMKLLREKADYELKATIEIADSEGALTRATTAMKKLEAVGEVRLRGVVSSVPKPTFRS